MPTWLLCKANKICVVDVPIKWSNGQRVNVPTGYRNCLYFKKLMNIEHGNMRFCYTQWSKHYKLLRRNTILNKRFKTWKSNFKAISGKYFIAISTIKNQSQGAMGNWPFDSYVPTRLHLNLSLTCIELCFGFGEGGWLQDCF